MPKRTNVSQAGGSQSRASLDSGTVVPQSTPATISAAYARADGAAMTVRLRSTFMPP
jgi:hypothetical protein